MADAGPSRLFGEGPLSRVTSTVYTLLVIEALLLLTSLPGLVPLVLLDRDNSNIPFAALCAIPLGPAFSAALFALRKRSRDLTDLRPGRSFWRGYRSNFKSSLLVWVPGVFWLGIIALGLSTRSDAGLASAWAVLLGLVGLLVTLWLVNALVITSLFVFRTLDIARLALYFIARKPLVALGNAGVLIVAVFIIVSTSEAVLTLFGSVLALLLLRTSLPMIEITTKEFTK